MERLKRIEDWIGENAVMIGSAVLVLIALWCVPSFHLKRWDLPKATPQEKFLLENESRKTLAQVLIGLFGLYALLLTFRRTRAQEKATEIAEQGHITDRFTKAVEQLGKMDDQKPNIPVRLGAIYALERIARDSERD
ncbi:MAG: hypothetical protein K2Q23_08770, partial [Bryobacteraceae bacterium]|nr:hypothetical protein [Bryobacteraceae bacterium]